MGTKYFSVNKNNRNRNYTINNVSCTIISIKVNSYKIIKRSMMLSPSRTITKVALQHAGLSHNSTLISPTSALRKSRNINVEERSMSYKKGMRFKNLAKQDLSTDDKGHHSHVVEIVCNHTNCLGMRCLTTCSNILYMRVQGHLTHKPTIGKFYRFIASFDAKDNAIEQFFIKNPVEKHVSETEMETTYKDGLKENKAVTNYINSPDVADKFN